MHRLTSEQQPKIKLEPRVEVIVTGLMSYTTVLGEHCPTELSAKMEMFYTVFDSRYPHVIIEYLKQGVS